MFTINIYTFNNDFIINSVFYSPDQNTLRTTDLTIVLQNHKYF